MNYLAHAFLADGDDEFLIGSFIGDFVKGRPAGRFSRRVIDGIIFHRKIDAYADSHPRTLASRQLFSPERRRYAGIVLDICNDHFLSKHWSSYSDRGLTEFIAHVYGTLQRHQSILPKRLKEVLPRMLEQNWLACYRSLSGVGITLERISRRLSSKGPHLREAADEVADHYDALEKNAVAFFRDLMPYSRSYRQTAVGADPI
jgi:acyl carrier protein phosphodiesterase